MTNTDEPSADETEDQDLAALDADEPIPFTLTDAGRLACVDWLEVA